MTLYTTGRTQLTLLTGLTQDLQLRIMQGYGDQPPAQVASDAMQYHAGQHRLRIGRPFADML